MTTQPDAPPAPFHFLAALRRHVWLMVGVAALVMGGFVAYVYLAPRAYRSQAKVYIGLGRQNTVLDPTTALDSPSPVTAIPMTRDAEMNSIIEILKSRDVLTQVVDAIGPQAILGRSVTTREAVADTRTWANGRDDRSWAQQEVAGPSDPGERTDDRYKALLALQKALDAENVRKSDVLQITYDGPDPDVARKVVGKVLDLFLARYADLNRASGSTSFISEQTARLAKDLHDAEERLHALQVEGQFGSADGQRVIHETRIGRLEDEMLKTRGEMAAARAEVAGLRQELQGSATTRLASTARGPADSGLDTMRLRLFELKLKLTEMLERRSANDPDVRLLRQQIAQAAQIIEREEVSLALAKVEPRLRSLEAQEQVLTNQLAGEREKLRAFADYQLKVQRAKRDVELQDAYYRKAKVALQTADVEQELNARRLSNLKVVQHPTFDVKPIRPRRLVLLGTGAVIAVLAAVAAAALVEFARSTRLTSLPELAPGARPEPQALT
jgi:uncharacterized protein involved in exopolysaccharide biosynthesis